MIGVHIGDNEALGGTNKGPFGLGATIRGTTLRTDGVELVKDGKLRV